MNTLQADLRLWTKLIGKYVASMSISEDGEKPGLVNRGKLKKALYAKKT
jgi:hypothetical protein